jgi:hypothetical protein
MRALCGAIISAGALIGLGLFAIGVGMRYSTQPYHDLQTGEVQFVHLRHIDTALIVTLVTLLMVLVIGLGIAFLGLAYHHHRRHMEMLHHHHTTPPGDRISSERVTV